MNTIPHIWRTVHQTLWPEPSLRVTVYTRKGVPCETIIEYSGQLPKDWKRIVELEAVEGK